MTTEGKTKNAAPGPAVLASTSQATPKLEERRFRDSRLIFLVTWVSGILAAAASIPFGIWAPLSYKVAADGNRDNNVVQPSMVASIAAVNSLAIEALSTAKAQISLL